ncbi:MAG: hypothetical protein J6A79_12360 [Clostridia bacterium]|nr:hypothetical protein [Clostridia bacterium]
MENLENKKELNEVEEEKVAGGMIWPGIPPLDPFNPLNENKAPVEANRPLPFPQDRRGNKAPVEAPSKCPGKC